MCTHDIVCADVYGTSAFEMEEVSKWHREL
jgi:hypothetical protein